MILRSAGWQYSSKIKLNLGRPASGEIRQWRSCVWWDGSIPRGLSPTWGCRLRGRYGFPPIIRAFPPHHPRACPHHPRFYPLSSFLLIILALPPTSLAFPRIIVAFPNIPCISPHNPRSNADQCLPMPIEPIPLPTKST